MSDKLDKLANFTPDSKITGNDVKVKHVAGYEILFKKSIPQPHGQDTGFHLYRVSAERLYI